jgi:hypothetical protein
MKHLEDVELVDWLDGVLADDRRQHADACAECRTRMSALQADASRAAEVNVPEPSPLFWEHFSARVHEAIAAEPRPSAWFAWRRSAPAVWAASAACAAILLLGMFWSATLPGLRQPQPPVASNTGPGDSDTLPLPIEDMGSDEEWALVRVAAEDLQWEDAPAAGLAARPGSADRVALELSEAERLELVRLLQTELNNRSGA